MITIVCTNCQATLQIDDGFAGGVCRCQHCGTIQTVPKIMAAGRPKAPGGAVKQSVGSEHGKSLYQVKSRAGMSSHPSGLEELAEVVHSSGLGSGLLNKRPRSLDYQHPHQPKSNKMWLWIALGAGGLVLLLLLAGLFFFRAASTPATVASAGAVRGGAPGVQATAPTFGNIPLSGDRVVYVLDRGDATSEYLGVIRDITLKSVHSLGGDRRFAVIFWKSDREDAFPSGTLAYANPDELTRLSNWFDEVPTGGGTSFDSAVAAAMKLDPDQVIFVTGKALQLDRDAADKILKLRGTRKAAFDVLSIAGPSSGDPLETVAKKTGGTFRAIANGSDLRALNP